MTRFLKFCLAIAVVIVGIFAITTSDTSALASATPEAKASIAVTEPTLPIETPVFTTVIPSSNLMSAGGIRIIDTGCDDGGAHVFLSCEADCTGLSFFVMEDCVYNCQLPGPPQGLVISAGTFLVNFGFIQFTVKHGCCYSIVLDCYRGEVPCGSYATYFCCC